MMIKLKDAKPGDKVKYAGCPVGVVIGAMPHKREPDNYTAVLIGYPSGEDTRCYHTKPAEDYCDYDSSKLTLNGYDKYYAWLDCAEVELIERAPEPTQGSGLGWLIGVAAVGGVLASISKSQQREVVRVNEPTCANDEATTAEQESEQMSR